MPYQFEEKKLELADHFMGFLKQIDPNFLMQLLPTQVLQELSFYNFYNAITACYFTDKDFNITQINKTFLNTFGVNDYLDKSLFDVFKSIHIPDEDIEVFKNQIKEKGWARINQIKISSDDGTSYYSLFSTFTEFKDNDRLSGFQGQFIDISQKVLLEKRQDAMAGQIRHDMKNRIAATSMSSQMMISELSEILANSENISEKVKDHLEMSKEMLEEIKSNSDYLSNMILQILDISKLQSNQLTLKLSKFKIRDVMNDVTKALKQQQQSKNIEVSIGGDESVEIEADHIQLSRVLENYHSNGLKYTKTKLSWNYFMENDDLIITLQDDGEGLEKAHLERIFDPFFQVPGKEKKGSTGLGLDSVRELVKLHGGETWAESDGPGHGSRFLVKIPVAQSNGGN
jgi:signal transduction histidine kinase